MDWTNIERHTSDRRTNAVLAWMLVGLIAAIAVSSLFVGDLLWAGFTTGIVILALVPAVYYRSPRAMVPWEVLALAVPPVLGYALGVGGASDFSMYLSVAALALMVAVELQLFTTVDMSAGFAVFFVVITTMAAAGVWGVVRWVADLYLETGFIAGPNALMWEFVASTVAGAVAGVVFEFYFRRRGRSQGWFTAEAEGERA